jgi:hypothetical protein
MKRNEMGGTGVKTEVSSTVAEPSVQQRPTKTITSGNIKTNKEIEAQKKQMNQVIRKLESVNVKRKNIAFDI